jgi:hypothetical protein
VFEGNNPKAGVNGYDINFPRFIFDPPYEDTNQTRRQYPSPFHANDDTVLPSDAYR